MFVCYEKYYFERRTSDEKKRGRFFKGKGAGQSCQVGGSDIISESHKWILHFQVFSFFIITNFSLCMFILDDIFLINQLDDYFQINGS